MDSEINVRLKIACVKQVYIILCIVISVEFVELILYILVIIEP